jgi:hypothetical protein
VYHASITFQERTGQILLLVRPQRIEHCRLVVLIDPCLIVLVQYSFARAERTSELPHTASPCIVLLQEQVQPVRLLEQVVDYRFAFLYVRLYVHHTASGTPFVAGHLLCSRLNQGKYLTLNAAKRLLLAGSELHAELPSQPANLTNVGSLHAESGHAVRLIVRFISGQAFLNSYRTILQ